MDRKIGVASMTLGAGFPGVVYSLLKKQLQPGHSFVECSSVLEKTSEALQARLMALLEGGDRPDALIGICVRPDARTVAAYRAARIPIVLIDEEVAGASTVASDNFAGGLLAARHLVQTGRRTMGIVSGVTGVEGGYNAAARVKGFTKGLADAGLLLPLEHTAEVKTYSRKEGVDAMERFLDEGRKFDAVFCAAGDVCATGILAAARAQGQRVPEQLALIGYDDNPAAASADPPLTTLRQPVERIAAEAYQLATAGSAAALDRPRRALFEPELVVRVSTQRAGARTAA